MQATMEANFALAQFEHALGDSVIKTRMDVKWILDKIKDLTFKVSATKSLQKNDKELIGSTALHIAAHNEHFDSFRLLLDLGVDCTIKNDDNMTALQIILEEDTSILEKSILDDSFVHKILSAHLKSSNFENPSNNSGLSHFHVACAANNAELVKGFLQNGVLINQSVKVDSLLFAGFTPLHFATKYCASEVVEVLLSHGADIYAKSANGMTPLMLALESRLKIITEATLDEEVRDRNEKILKLFLEKESSNYMITDGWGLSQLHVACTLKDSKIAESLLEKVVNIDHAVNMDPSLWPSYTALHFAALCNIDTVKLLMKKGADISIKDSKGVTPFDMCIERYKIEEIYAILSLHPIWNNIILSDGKTKLTDLVFAMKNSNDFFMFSKRLRKNVTLSDSPLWLGYTPMHLAVLFSDVICDSKTDTEEINFQTLRSIFKKNHKSLLTQDAQGRTPLHLAFLLNKKPVIDLLLEVLDEARFKSSDLFDEDGLSYVHIACAQNNDAFLKRMLSIGSDVNAVYKGKSLISRMIQPGSTTLHFAVVNGSVAAAEILMKQGADVYAKDANDMTPIHLLLMNSEADILLSSPNLKDCIVSGIGLSHLHIATRCDKPEIVEKLLDDGANINDVISYKPNTNTEQDKLSFLKKYDGFSPLIIAHGVKYSRSISLLLKRGADIFIKDKENKPLLYEVIENVDDELEEFLETIKKNKDLQVRLKAETGMTALHFACLFNEYETIERLLTEGSNVNEQIFADSPIFQGYTPLHMTVFASNIEVVKKTIKLLIKNGADVTMPNAESDTPVHMSYGILNDDEEEGYSCLNLLLEAQRDFNMNPENLGGVTHFHIACSICNTRIVKKFLKYADIDINQAIDYFHEDKPGYTALHLVLDTVNELDYVLKQLNTIEVLLEYGASVHIEDSYGDIPLHNCVRFDHSGSLDLFERIARAGADVNARNLEGYTPLYYYLDSDNITHEGIKTLLRMGCRLNIFSVSDYGYMGQILRRLDTENLPELLSVIAVNFRQGIEIDETGRTAIHNIVSDDQIEISADEYVILIEHLSRAGFNVDCQDQLGICLTMLLKYSTKSQRCFLLLGRSALYMAVNFHNLEGISGLLMAGADVNITDINGKTALAYDVDTCTRCQTDNENKESNNDKIRQHLAILEVLAIHINKLQSCGLDVNKQNEDHAVKISEKLKQKLVLPKKFCKELESIKNAIIKGRQPLCLNDFLSETSAVARYPKMSWLQRDAVKKFFSLRKCKRLREKYPELAGILQLQYKKARARAQLIKLAENALTILTEFRLPVICSDCIFALLTNKELDNVIASTV